MPSSAGVPNPWWPWRPTEPSATPPSRHSVKKKLRLLVFFAFIAILYYLSLNYLSNTAAP